MLNLLQLKSLLEGTGIYVSDFIDNTKASEFYVSTTFVQDDGFRWHTYVPYVDRRAGLNIETEEELRDYLLSLKPYFTQSAMEQWRRDELAANIIGGDVTPIFFRVLLSFEEEFDRFPANPNSARRIQDIKDAGYTIASVPKKDGRGFNRILLPIPRHTERGYEMFTPQFKARVIRILNERNAFEARKTARKALIPDHKFSEVRWDEETKAENSMEMTDAQIVQKFQLLDNQRNQQKREICRNCFQSGIRGTIYGIPYFYEGNEEWDASIPKVGKAAEKGCIGCPWYDIEEWRKHLNKLIDEQIKKLR